jgi:uncharacterized protein (DUF1330 family)
MAAYVIAEIEVTDPETYERYKELASASIAAHGGRYVARGGAAETLEGDWSPKRMVVLEFPAAADARAWWAGSDYESAKALRQASARTRMILVEGV